MKTQIILSMVVASGLILSAKGEAGVDCSKMGEGWVKPRAYNLKQIKFSETDVVLHVGCVKKTGYERTYNVALTDGTILKKMVTHAKDGGRSFCYRGEIKIPQIVGNYQGCGKDNHPVGRLQTYKNGVLTFDGQYKKNGNFQIEKGYDMENGQTVVRKFTKKENSKYYLQSESIKLDRDVQITTNYVLAKNGEYESSKCDFTVKYKGKTVIKSGKREYNSSSQGCQIFADEIGGEHYKFHELRLVDREIFGEIHVEGKKRNFGENGFSLMKLIQAIKEKRTASLNINRMASEVGDISNYLTKNSRIVDVDRQLASGIEKATDFNPSPANAPSLHAARPR